MKKIDVIMLTLCLTITYFIDLSICLIIGIDILSMTVSFGFVAVANFMLFK